MKSEIDIFLNREKAIAKKRAHERLGRTASIETFDECSVFDFRADDLGEGLVIEDRPVHVVTARWE